MFFASVSPTAEAVGKIPWITNSTVSAVIVVAVIVIFVQLATRQVALVPAGAQNFLEWLLESLYGAIESVVGSHMVRKTMPLLAAYFIFILTANWMGLLPGVGTIGWLREEGGHTQFVPLFRGANADLNMTLALASSFMLIWFIWTIREVGFTGFLKHNFGPKGLLETQGVGTFLKIAIVLLNIFLCALFFGVGVIELVSIASRLLSLPMRLYGNIYAGENLIESLMAIAGPWWGILFCIPAYFMELLVGIVQAMVFMLLCSVYTALSTAHDEEGGH
jgi:F-type H+-transporting ATPase subunit a